AGQISVEIPGHFSVKINSRSFGTAGMMLQSIGVADVQICTFHFMTSGRILASRMQRQNLTETQTE
uniref:hypothetical protein n=1 Tax=Agrobacterium sp. TaxID=361 RepID=UPI00289D79C8